MIYAYVDPVRQHAGKLTLGFLEAIQEQLGLQSFDDFVKNKGVAPGATAEKNLKTSRLPNLVQSSREGI